MTVTATLLGLLIASSVLLGPDSLGMESEAELACFSLMPANLNTSGL